MKYNLGVMILFHFLIIACKNVNEVSNQINQLSIGNNQDTLETGYWEFYEDSFDIASHGQFIDGFRDSVWIYKKGSDSLHLYWETVNVNQFKLNLPEEFNVKLNIDSVISVFGDLNDNDQNTYFTMLRYVLPDSSVSINNYTNELSNALKVNSTVDLANSEMNRYNFPNIDIIKVELQFFNNYRSVSYIFQKDNILVDMTMKLAKNDYWILYDECFKNILYSIEVDKEDIFNFYSKQYLNSEKLNF